MVQRNFFIVLEVRLASCQSHTDPDSYPHVEMVVEVVMMVRGVLVTVLVLRSEGW